MDPRDAASRDLLFGLLALQNGLIDQVQLVAAFQARTRDKEHDLADHLVARGDLDAEQRAGVEAMVALHLKKHGGDTGRSLAAIPAGLSTRESLARINDPVIHATMTRVGSASDASDGAAADRTATYSVGSATGDGRRFRILRPHARGGLGAVFVALDEELHREVALKQILDHHADDPTSRQRFLLEAEITGGLEHPGIVPVYGLGTYGDGRPYYAMRFIRGDSLKDAIAQYHENAAIKDDAGARSLGLRKLLRRFTDVCNAIDYAHTRGVLHRDIKPGNVIVGRHGETLVIDWGLAKPMGRSEPGTGSEERTLMPGSAGGSAETLPGSALGTPAFMSPEQAAGDRDRLGPRSDVYSLGATLYCLLTGNPPFAGDDLGAILRAVQKGEFPPPRAVDPAIDRALEAVCLKAMAVSPDDRYASCRALADDVERWTADEPVSAYPEPLARRAGRWARRNKTAVTVAAALLVAGTVGLAVSNVLVNRQKARAEANFQLARQAVDDMYTQVAEKWLAQEPQMEPLQREFLQKALAFYERFARPDGASAELRREAGKAARRVGEIRQKLGENAAADAAFRRSQETLQGVTDDPMATQELAVTANRRGWFLWTLGRSPDTAFAQALALGTVLIRRIPATPESRKELARAYSSQGLVHAAHGRFAEAETAHRQALALREALVRDFPAVADYRQDVARSHANLATVLRQTGRFREADEASSRAVGFVEALVAKAPRDPHFRSDLAHDLDEWANLLALLGRPREAQTLLLRARDVSGRLSNDFPSFIEYQNLHSAVRRDLAILLGNRGQSQDARRNMERATAVAEILVRRNPDVPNYRRTLAVHRANLGDLLHTAGRPVDAEREYREALRLTEALVAEHPGLLDYRTLRALYRSSVAFLFRITGRYLESESAYENVVADLEALQQEFPGVPHLRASLASACNQRGAVLDLLKRPRESESTLARAIGLAEGLAAEIPGVPSYHVTAAQALGSLAQQSLDRGETDRARRSNERAIRHMEAALATDPESNLHRYLSLRTASALAQIQAREGDSRAVDASARRIEDLPRSPIDHYNAACFLSLTLSAVRGSKLPEAERTELARSLAERSMAQLTKAINNGYRNLDLIRKDSDLDPLRTREDFKPLLERAEGKMAKPE